MGVIDGTPYSSLPSSLLSSDNVTFDRYLKTRSNAISAALSDLFRQTDKSTPELLKLQDQIGKLLAMEKRHVNELEKSRLEKEQLEERLESASVRYMVAEKKLDRAKSMTVAKLERQATAGGHSDAGSGLGGVVAVKSEFANGQTDNSESLAKAETAWKEVTAVSAKQKEQIDQLAADNAVLTTQTTALQTRLSHLTDDDYAHSDLFKYLKSQHEDVIRRVNDLEAINVELREEAQKLQAERTEHRIQLESELQAAASEKEIQLTKAEVDLARIRTARDELQAELQIKKAAISDDRVSVNQMHDLVAAKEDRIKALELEIARLKVPVGEPDMDGGGSDQWSPAELRTRYSTLERQSAMLNQELQSMEAAFKKASTSAAQKIDQQSHLEEKGRRLMAEKARADQKYFAAMKAKDAREQEIRSLRAQNSKSSDIVSQLKEAEAATRALVSNLEKGVAEAKETCQVVTKQQRTGQQLVAEKTILMEGLKKEIDELQGQLVSKDQALHGSLGTARRAEVEVEALKVGAEEGKKSVGMWKSKALGNQSEENQMLRVRSSSFPFFPFLSFSPLRNLI